jgi:hypothetical protein
VFVEVSKHAVSIYDPGEPGVNLRGIQVRMPGILACWNYVFIVTNSGFITPPTNSISRRPVRHAPFIGGARRSVTSSASQTTGMTGMVFRPFTEVQGELAVVTKSPSSQSFARVDFHPECEAAINEQIK